MVTKFIVAVSGGVDSVVLLDLMIKRLKAGGSASHSETSWHTKESWKSSQESLDVPAQIVNVAGQPAEPHRVEMQAEDNAATRRLQGEERAAEFTSVALAEGQAPPEIILAHVDHGIRDDSAADARFVAGLATRYGLEYRQMEAQLGPGASEDAARTARYKFLKQLAQEHQAKIVAAHHQDDIIGSIAINLHRGTGWRGLAVMNGAGIVRPLLAWTKRQIYDYARDHRLEWVEDSTNQSDIYLRNRLRRDIHQQLSPTAAAELVQLRKQQCGLRAEIDAATDELLAAHHGSRYFYTMIDTAVATELLRAEIAQHTGAAPTIPQAERALIAVKTAAPGTQHDVGDGAKLQFEKSNFIVASHL